MNIPRTKITRKVPFRIALKNSKREFHGNSIIIIGIFHINFIEFRWKFRFEIFMKYYGIFTHIKVFHKNFLRGNICNKLISKTFIIKNKNDFWKQNNMNKNLFAYIIYKSKKRNKKN